LIISDFLVNYLFFKIPKLYVYIRSIVILIYPARLEMPEKPLTGKGFQRAI